MVSIVSDNLVNMNFLKYDGSLDNYRPSNGNSSRNNGFAGGSAKNNSATNISISQKGMAAFEKMFGQSKANGNDNDNILTRIWDIGSVEDPLAALKQFAADGFEDLDKFIENARNQQNGSGSFNSLDEMLKSLTTATLAMKHHSLEIAGKTEQAQALRDSAVGGTLKFEDATKVDGLNATYDKVSTQNAFGGEDVHWDLNQNPTGKVKDAIDSGESFTMGQGELGAFYVTVG